MHDFTTYSSAQISCFTSLQKPLLTISRGPFINQLDSFLVIFDHFVDHFILNKVYVVIWTFGLPPPTYHVYMVYEWPLVKYKTDKRTKYYSLWQLLVFPWKNCYLLTFFVKWKRYVYFVKLHHIINEADSWWRLTIKIC